MDPQGILTAAQQASPLAVLVIVGGGLIFAGIKIIGWGQDITKLLGNHLRHDLGDVRDEMRSVKHVLETMADATNEQNRQLKEQTAVLKAVGRVLLDPAPKRVLVELKDEGRDLLNEPDSH